MKSPRFFLTFILVLIYFIPLPICRSSSISEAFDSWCKEHEKRYQSQHEKEQRLKIFEENYSRILEHNSRGNSSYTLGLNAFADWSNSELRELYMPLSASDNDPVIRLNTRPAIEGFHPAQDSDLPPSVDWRDRGAVTEVRFEGTHGRQGPGWAFAATGAIEGINKIVTGSLIKLSEQELLDCDPYDHGYMGGIMTNAYKFVIENRGIDTEDDYGYHRHFYDGHCNPDKIRRRVVTIDGYVEIPANNETMLQRAVAQQPVSVIVYCNDYNFVAYQRGIYSGECSTDNEANALLIVGYDSNPKEGKDYWIVKNSWGRNWGMGGYMYILRNTGIPEGVCGINRVPSYPIKTSPNPPTPPPTPDPRYCSFWTWTWCYNFQTCCCYWDFLGVCWIWDCCTPKARKHPAMPQ